MAAYHVSESPYVQGNLDASQPQVGHDRTPICLSVASSGWLTTVMGDSADMLDCLSKGAREVRESGSEGVGVGEDGGGTYAEETEGGRGSGDSAAWDRSACHFGDYGRWWFVMPSLSNTCKEL